MRAITVFDTEVADLLASIPAVPETPELVVADLPCGLFFHFFPFFLFLLSFHQHLLFTCF